MYYLELFLDEIGYNRTERTPYRSLPCRHWKKKMHGVGFIASVWLTKNGGGGGAILGAKSTTSDRDVNTDWLRHFAKDIRKIRNSLFLHYQTLNVYTWDNLINPFTRAKLVMYRLKLAPQFLSPSMKSFINVTIQIKAINERLSK